jgi:hypothetical protein
MSNDKDRARLFNLIAKISMMVVDGKRDAKSVADVLQGILNQSKQKPTFDPAAFIDKGWSFAEARNPRSATLGLLDDYSKVTLSTDWLKGRASINGKFRHKRILANIVCAPLNTDHLLDLWNNKEKIPEVWKKVGGVITFDGDILLGPSGGRCVLCLFRDGSHWRWFCELIDTDWDVDSPSAVLASS